MVLLLDQSHVSNHLRPLVEQLDDLAVDGVDALPGRDQRLCKVRAWLGEKSNGRTEKQQRSHGHELYQAFIAAITRAWRKKGTG
jgi:hypothetical protein